MGQPDPTRNSIDPNPFLTRLKWPVTCSPINPTRPAHFAMSSASFNCIWGYTIIINSSQAEPVLFLDLGIPHVYFCIHSIIRISFLYERSILETQP